MELYSVMVTGANRGIGLEFVRQLVSLNSPPKHIFATYRDSNSLKELKDLQDAFQETTKISLIKLDVTNISDITNASKIVEDIVDETGLTCLINNSGVVKLCRCSELTKDDLDFHFSTNVAGPMLVTQKLYHLLKRSAEKRGDGPGMSFSRAGVLNMSSMAGCITQTTPEVVEKFPVAAYQISKAALNMGMRIVAGEANQDKILVVSMCPGWVKTDMGTELAEIEPKDSIAAMLDTISKLNESHSGVFMNRHGTPYPF